MEIRAFRHPRKSQDVSRMGDSVMWLGLSGNWIISFTFE
jgi:hypothetical protein